jgi:hypothetical protein
MQRTEQSFRAMHQRLMYLEEREAWRGPSDEQLERVLRKILAEKFNDANVQQGEQAPNALKNVEYFVERPKEDASIPKAIPINMAALQVDAAAVPSENYQQTLRMLESEIVDFPHVDLSRNTQRDSVHDQKDPSSDFKRPKQPSSVNHARPWV